jgi:hypothetical protein
MGNKKNERKRVPTAKKLEADLQDPADPPRHSSSSTRPKPRPTYKGSAKNPKPSEPIVSKKAQAVTSESDASIDDAASGEDEVIDMEEDEEDEEDSDEEDVEVKGKATTRSAPGMVIHDMSHKRLKLTYICSQKR